MFNNNEEGGVLMRKVQSYSPEFREEAVKAILEQGLSLAEGSRCFSVPKATLANWMAATRVSVKKAEALASSEAVSLTSENARLRKDLAETRLERDILKKAMAYFAKESLPSTRS